MKTSILFGLAVAAGMGLTGCGGGESTVESAATGINLPTVEVTVAPVTTSAPDASYRELPGTVRATSRATVSAKVMGPLTQVPAVGQFVDAGELVAQISVPEIEANAAQAKAALELATRQYQREATLLDQGASTAETVDNLRDQRAIAAAQFDATRAQQAHTRITAPFAGRIAARMAELGDLAAPGQPLFALEGQALEIEVGVPESLPQPEVGGEVRAHIDGQLIPCIVRETTASADPITRTRLTRLAVPVSVATHPGQFVRVSWPEPTASLLQIPSAAISTVGQMQRVFVVENAHAQLRLVRTGTHAPGGQTVILAGLTAGETVVLNPPASLRDGQPLQVQP